MNIKIFPQHTISASAFLIAQRTRTPRGTLRCLCAVACLIASLSSVSTAQRRTRAASPRTPSTTSTQTSTATRSITIRTEPATVVWIDDIRYGTTDASGTLLIPKAPAGRHTLRARAAGFAEHTQSVVITPNLALTVRLTPTTDAAELAFQQAEAGREKGDTPGVQTAIENYRRAISLRPRPAILFAAHIGLARTLADTADYAGALEQVDAARRARPNNPEASAVEGRVLLSQNDTEGAIAAFNRAIREGRGVQPEAFTGLGRIHEERGDHAQAVVAFKKAVAQLNDTEPVLYQLLGSAHEQAEQFKEAVAAYEKYLQLAPNGRLAPAIASVIEQLRRQANGESVLQP